MLRFFTFAASLLASLAISLADDAPNDGGERKAVFGSVALPFSPVSLARWIEITDLVTRSGLGACESSTSCKARAKILSQTMQAVEGLEPIRQAKGINVAVNRLLDYAEDADVYGESDHWGTPIEIMAAGRGDCEDFAILKYAALRRIGMSADEMSLVIVREKGTKSLHAVLIVTLDGRNLVLDNRSDEILEDVELHDYVALYTLGDGRAWINGITSS